jgi:intracellular multiplication protein IcmJ
MGSFLPITLGIARSGGGYKSSSPSGVSGDIGADLKNRVLTRDQHGCRFCGFVSKKYQEVIPRPDAPAQGRTEEHYVTACQFCTQCFNLQIVGTMKSGMLVWLPEISQASLHHMMRAIYVARISQGPVAEAARAAYDALIARREEAKKRLSTDDPATLATILNDYLTPAQYAARVDKLEGIRLFPLDRRIIKESDLEFNQFPQILAYWRSKDGPFGGNPPQQWLAYSQSLLQAA